MKKMKFFKLTVFIFAFIVGMSGVFADTLTLTTNPIDDEVHTDQDPSTGTKWKKLGDKLAFCSSGFGVATFNGAIYVPKAVSDADKSAIAKIFVEGNAKNIEFNNSTQLLDYFKVQAAIYRYFNPSGTACGNYCSAGDTIKNAAANRSDTKINTVSISPATQQLAYDSASQKYKGTYTISGAKDSVTCSVSGVTGAEVSAVGADGKVTVSIPKASLSSMTVDGTITCTGAKEYYYSAEGYSCSTVNGADCSSTQELFVYDEKSTSKSLSATFNISTKSTVTISKTDATGQKELPGAKLSILDKDGKVLNKCVFDKTNHKITYSDGSDAKACTWTSEETSYIMEGLPVGKYYLVEDIAPEGYEKSSEKIEIEITDAGAVKDKVVMINSPKKVPVPDTLSTKSAILLTISMIDVALGIGLLLYIKKNKILN